MIAGILSRLNQAPVRCMLNPASIIEPASIVDGYAYRGLARLVFQKAKLYTVRKSCHNYFSPMKL